MKALSIRQPWASLILADHPNRKDVENRNWYTSFRGDLLIHTSKTKDENFDYLLLPQPLDLEAKNILFNSINKNYFGAIIGKVKLIDVIKNSSSKWASPGSYHWLLAEPEIFEKPFYCKGQLGLFDVRIDLLGSYDNDLFNQANNQTRKTSVVNLKK